MRSEHLRLSPGTLVRGTRDLQFGTHMGAQLWTEQFAMAYPDHPWDRDTVALYLGPVNGEVDVRFMGLRHHVGWGSHCFHRVLIGGRVMLVYGDESLEACEMSEESDMGAQAPAEKRITQALIDNAFSCLDGHGRLTYARDECCTIQQVLREAHGVHLSLNECRRFWEWRSRLWDASFLVLDQIRVEGEQYMRVLGRSELLHFRFNSLFMYEVVE